MLTLRCPPPMQRSILTDQQLREEVVALEKQGHRRLLVLTGEHPKYTFDQFLNVLASPPPRRACTFASASPKPWAPSLPQLRPPWLSPSARCLRSPGPQDHRGDSLRAVRTDPPVQRGNPLTVIVRHEASQGHQCGEPALPLPLVDLCFTRNATAEVAV